MLDATFNLAYPWGYGASVCSVPAVGLFGPINRYPFHGCEPADGVHVLTAVTRVSAAVGFHLYAKTGLTAPAQGGFGERRQQERFESLGSPMALDEQGGGALVES